MTTMIPIPEDHSNKRKVLHLRLTCEDWIETFKELNKAELGVFYYIRTLDPYGDRELEIDSAEVAEKLGIHRTSVSRALKTLNKKQLISLEISKAKVSSRAKNNKPTLLCADAQPVHGRTTLSADAQPVHGRTTLSADAHHLSADAHHLSADAHHLSADAHHLSADAHHPYIRNAHTQKLIQTYSDFKNSLSNSVRERFLNFSRQKAAALPQQPTLVESWIEAHHKELFAEFEKCSGGVTTKQNIHDWGSDPRYLNEWRSLIHLGPKFFQVNGETDLERFTCWQWARENDRDAYLGTLKQEGQR